MQNTNRKESPNTQFHSLIYYDVRIKLNTDAWKETLRRFTIHCFPVTKPSTHCGEQKNPERLNGEQIQLGKRYRKL